MDKIVFITGASSGIGAGCARKFASQGASLILNARNVNKLSALKEELEKQYGAKIYLLPFDVRDRKAATSALESLPKEWQSIDILVNNAGLVIGTDKEQEGSLDEWDIVIDTNIKALLAMTRLMYREWWNVNEDILLILVLLPEMLLIREVVCIVLQRLL